jgi:hypothetical protein
MLVPVPVALSPQEDEEDLPLLVSTPPPLGALEAGDGLDLPARNEVNDLLLQLVASLMSLVDTEG